MACNNVKMLPEALLRSGRIELWLKTELPKQRVRQQILEYCTRGDNETLRGVHRTYWPPLPPATRYSPPLARATHHHWPSHTHHRWPLILTAAG